MQIKHIATLAAALCLVSGIASAQPSAAPATRGAVVLHELEDDQMMVSGLNVTFGDLREMGIYGTDGRRIGRVSKILADSANTVMAVGVQVGGFLGMGSRDVVIPISKLHKGNEKDRLVTAMNKSEVEQLQEWSVGYRGDAAPGEKPDIEQFRHIRAWE